MTQYTVIECNKIWYNLICYTIQWITLKYCNYFKCNVFFSPQISTFSFDIFLNAGIPKDKIRYVTVGLGVSEIITSIFCVSIYLSFTEWYSLSYFDLFTFSVGIIM